MWKGLVMGLMTGGSAGLVMGLVTGWSAGLVMWLVTSGSAGLVVRLVTGGSAGLVMGLVTGGSAGLTEWHPRGGRMAPCSRLWQTCISRQQAAGSTASAATHGPHAGQTLGRLCKKLGVVSQEGRETLYETSSSVRADS